jgi:hypothetical protein
MAAMGRSDAMTGDPGIHMVCDASGVALGLILSSG